MIILIFPSSISSMSISNQSIVNQNDIGNEALVNTVDFRVQSCSCILGKDHWNVRVIAKINKCCYAASASQKGRGSLIYLLSFPVPRHK